jgi:hypothetical protein
MARTRYRAHVTDRAPTAASATRATIVCVAAAVAAAVVASLPTACAQIIGVDQERTLTEAGVSGSDGGTASVPTQTVGDCADGQKRCDGACVPVTDPTFGCDAVACAKPCSLPHAATTKCEAGKCGVATCAPGYADCDGIGDTGCEADITSPLTCNDCKVACPTGELCAPPPTGCTKNCGGLTACPDGRCVDTTTSVHDCGGCATATDPTHACTVVPNGNADAACLPGGEAGASTCGLSCHAGYGDCNNDPSDGCEAALVFSFADNDKDGYGAGNAVSSGCTVQPGMSGNSRDCLDTDARVNPGQTGFFGTAYTLPGGKLSFDYNCDNKEEGATTDYGGACAAGCATGYVTAGITANPWCGSTTKESCPVFSGTVSCASAAASAYACR